jgi:hypothetical protein
MSRKSKAMKTHELTFYSYPKLLFCWPLIVIGPLLWFITGSEPSAGKAEVLGWCYLMVILLVLLTVSVDVERNHAVFWAAVFLLFFFLGRWLDDAKGFTFFGDIYTWLAGLDARYDRGFGLALSILLAPPYIVMFVWSRLQYKWRITHNEFEHYAFGRADDSLARGAKRVRTTYPDLLELLLCGAGTLIVYSATGRSELRRIHHVPLLPVLRRRIDRILEATAVTEAEQSWVADEEVETERAEESLGSDESGKGIGDEKL